MNAAVTLREAEKGDKMPEYIININKRKINSVEVPKSAEVEVGDVLVLRLVNHGAPLHVSVSAVNARRYTIYLHENIYLKEEMEFKVPILSTAPTGAFQIDIITGYGIVKETFKVNVTDRSLELPEVLEDIPPTDEEPEKNNYGYGLTLALLVVAGWAAYILAIGYYGTVAGFSSVILLTIAVLLAWRRQP